MEKKRVRDLDRSDLGRRIEFENSVEHRVKGDLAGLIHFQESVGLVVAKTGTHTIRDLDYEVTLDA